MALESGQSCNHWAPQGDSGVVTRVVEERRVAQGGRLVLQRTAASTEGCQGRPSLRKEGGART